MRVLVCGGRKYCNYDLLADELEKHPITTIIHGCASGADTLAEMYGKNGNLIIERYKPEWDKYGKRAGPKRNYRMLEEGKPDLVVATPGGHGTRHMVSIARKAGLEVIEVADEYHIKY